MTVITTIYDTFRGMARGWLVTGLASTTSFVMINGKRYPGTCDMTGLANVGSLNMRRVLTDRNIAVVAVKAHPAHLLVIDGNYRRPFRGGVASTAQITRINMRRTFADSPRAIMAIKALAQYFGMIDLYRRHPLGC